MMRQLPSIKQSLFFVAVLFLLGTGVTIIEYNNRLPRPGYRLVEGRVVKKEVKKISTASSYGDSYSYEIFLTIKIVNTDTVLTARWNDASTNKIPDVVTFYYSGDPTERVSLLEDTSWLRGWMALLTITAIMLLGLILAVMLQKREQRYLHNQHKALLEKIRRY